MIFRRLISCLLSTWTIIASSAFTGGKAESGEEQLEDVARNEDSPFSPEIRILSADYSRRRSSVDDYVATNGKNFFGAPNDPTKLLRYSGGIPDNVVHIKLLDKALEYLNAQIVPDNQITKLFRYVRDRRYFPNDTVVAQKTTKGEFLVPKRRRSPEFLRRITWLYPDDGCYYRAEMACLWARDVIPVGPRTLHKIFLFGKPLNVSTKYDPQGWHTWSYHVAPLIRSATHGYLAVDPSLSFDKVLEVKEWIRAQLGGRRSVENAADILTGFVITNRFTFNPTFWNACDATESVFDPQNAFMDPYVYLTSKSTVDSMINNEWRRVIRLGLDPRKVLGDRPPWKKR